MKSIFRVLWLVILFSALIFDAFALDAPANFKVISSTDTSVNLTWDITPNAFMYHVYYTKDIWLNKNYENSSDLIEWNSTEIKNLEKGVNYSFVVTSIDENWEESVYSKDVALNNTVTNTATNTVTTETKSEDFVLDWIAVVAYNKVKLTFTNLLDNAQDATREFKITNKIDKTDTLEVISTLLDEKDNSILELTFNKDISVWTEYEVVIVAITSANWKNIESGIDNIETFTVKDTQEMDEMIELNAAWPVVLANPWTENTISSTTLTVAENKTVLPKTGPEQILMLILSVILWALIFVFKYKKA